MKRHVLNFSFLISFTFFLCVTEASAEKLRQLNVFKKNQEVVHYKVNIADTYEKQKMGLMYVGQLPEDQGMFFIYNQERKIGIWMKNTFIPLDIVFIDKNGVITEIVERPDTRSRKSTISQKPSKYVLEINLGETKKQGIQVGDKVLLAQDKKH